MKNKGLPLVLPKISPVLDSNFRPAILANRAFEQLARACPKPQKVELALEQADGSVFRLATEIFPEKHPMADANFTYIERRLKFLLWSHGGYKIHFSGPPALAEQLERYYREDARGTFDATMMGKRIYERPFQVVLAKPKEIPPARCNTAPLGRHLNGCRIGFDLGGSDRKAAAVLDGKPVFSTETIWDPAAQSDPRWHFNQIMDSLKSAAKYLPRVDAIGGSSAGVLVKNRIKVASIFRGVPADFFEQGIKDLFLELKKAWDNIPFEVVNDGEVTALAGSMSIGENHVLGIALGTSQAAGYVTRDGKITSWLNELAFAPVDYHPNAPIDEWSGDAGCGVQYFSQQCVGRLLPAAGINLSSTVPVPEKLKQVQLLMIQGDDRARQIYQTIGTYLGYAVAHYADFYDFKHVLLLGRVTSGPGGDVLVEAARAVLQLEFPELLKRVVFHLPGEKEKRHGQAIAAASLPRL